MSNNDLFFIAEAGINHNGSLQLAFDLIDMAVTAGCDAVKFQKRTPEICVPRAMKSVMRETPWGTIPYLKYKELIEFGQKEYSAISNYCLDRKILWSASAWDIPSLEFLDQFDLPFHKVASALATHTVFLEEVARRGVHTYASVGMCSFEQIDSLVAIFAKHKCPLTLMHTVSTYPALDSDLNLRMIETLGARYGLPIGYSGHETSVSPSIVAAALGAVAIERHITLDRAMWGTDHSASLEAPGLTQLIGALRKVPVVLGDGVKKEIEEEKKIASKMRYWE